MSHLIGLSAAKIPEEIIEDEEMFRTPLFFYKVKYGIPLNLALSGGIESNIISFHFDGGLEWSYMTGNFSFSPGISCSYWFGRLKQTGFDSKMYGINIYPNLSAGFSFRKFSLTLRYELIYTLDNTLKNGDVTITRDMKNFNGYSLAFYVEQPLWKGNVIVLGFRGFILELYYPVWAAFPSFDRRFFVSEITAGLIL